MKIYQIHAKQALPITAEKAWDFLSSPHNLKEITPKHMQFHIVSGGNQPMYAGQLIEYKVQPFKGYRTTWVTEITHVTQGKYFVDEQRFGPYALWHHKHFITEIDGGVVMEDLVHYKLPFGWLGTLMHPLLVKKQLQQIFKYREEKLYQLFGKIENIKPQLTFN